MPFPKQTPMPFTDAAIRNLNPGQNGCYGIYKQDEWIYVGKGDIRTRLLAHIGGESPDIIRRGPTNFVTVVTTDMDNEEKRLILELNPTCNRKVG